MEQFETYLPWIFDGVLAIYLLIMGIVGAKKGFFKGLVGFIGVIVAVVGAYLLAGPVANFLEAQFGWNTSLQGWFEENFLAAGGLTDYVLKEGDNFASIVGAIDIGIPPMILNFVFTNLVKIEGDFVGMTVAAVLAEKVSGVVMTALCGFVLFIVIAVILSLFSTVLSAIFNSLPLLGFVNGFLGFVLGLVKGVLFVCVVLFFMNMIPVDFIHNAIENSYVVKYVYQFLQTLLEMFGLISTVTPPVVE